MVEEDVYSWLQKNRVIAIIRGDYQPVLRPLVEALITGGIMCIEVTLNSPHALEMIHLLVEEYGNTVLVGAGTVTTVPQVEQASSLGVRFIISPDTFPSVIQSAQYHQLEALPGAFTPTEILMAARAGARLIKLFPASLGGVDYLHQLQGPLPDLSLVPTGGITAENAADYIRAGGVAVGISSALIPRDFDGSALAIEKVRSTATTILRRIQAVSLQDTT